jgi:hydrogenase maturation protease
MSANTLFVGIGSPHGDDRLGWHVAEAIAERLQERVLQQARIAVRKAGSPADLLDWLEGIDRLVICDACRGGGPAGCTYRWTWPDRAIAQAHSSGSHDLGLASILELAQRLDCLPLMVIVWGIEAEVVKPHDQLPSSGLSASPAARLGGIVETIWSELCSSQPEQFASTKTGNRPLS